MKRLRRKIVIGVFLSATVVFVLTIAIVSVLLVQQVNHRADAVTDLLIDSRGDLPDKSEYEKMEDQDFRIYNYTEESPYRMRYFTVFYDDRGNAVSDVNHIASVTDGEAMMIADIVKMSGEDTGNYDIYRYRVSTDGSMVAFVDFSEDFTAIEWLTLLLAVISIAFILMITIVFYFLSARIVKPFEENSKMQKQFITDASHELKTPIAIISANAEVLAYKDGENEWLNNITEQVTRISGLVEELLTLNRLEEVDEINNLEPVDLSALTEKVAGSFEEVFNSKHAQMTYDIQPEITLNGNPAQLERLVSVLVENASKYTSDNGDFSISLAKGTRYTTLSVFNSCEIDKSINYNHLFDRFYRPDSSRASSTGGHGIGLSIAKRIAVLHGGAIEAVPSDKGLTFNVKLSNKLKAGKQKGN